MLLLYRSVSLEGDFQQFYYLAKAFMHGQNFFTDKPGSWMDVIVLNHKYYWHLGPLPSLLILPLITLIPKVSYWSQSILHIFGVFSVAFVVNVLARLYKFSRLDSLLFVFLFLIGSVFIQLFFVNNVWFISQVLTTLFVLIYLYFSLQKKWTLAGIFLACAFACRLNAVIGLLFSLILLTKTAPTKKYLFQSALKLTLPLVIVGCMLGLYNYARFGSFTNNGYYLINNATWPESFTYELKTYGLFNPIYIPTNIYYYFLASVKPVLEERTIAFGNTYMLKPPFIRADYPGVSYITLSPLWLLPLLSKRKSHVLTAAKITTLCSVAVLLLYYWPGQIQLGSRYMADALPYMYLAILSTHQTHIKTRWYKIAVFASICFNLYLIGVFFTLGQDIDWTAAVLTR